MKYTEMYFYSINAVTVLGGRLISSIKYLNKEGQTPVPVAERALPLSSGQTHVQKHDCRTNSSRQIVLITL